jgi:hypothetical protein
MICDETSRADACARHPAPARKINDPAKAALLSKIIVILHLLRHQDGLTGKTDNHIRPNPRTIIPAILRIQSVEVLK